MCEFVLKDNVIVILYEINAKKLNFMKRFIICCLLFLFPFSFIHADRREVVLNPDGQQHNHGEYYPPADMPEAYFDDVDMEIIIEAEGFADYYIVEVVSMVSSLTMIYTQIDGYGDTIDVSSLPIGYYQIIITSEFNNVYGGYFLIE